MFNLKNATISLVSTFMVISFYVYQAWMINPPEKFKFVYIFNLNFIIVFVCIMMIIHCFQLSRKFLIYFSAYVICYSVPFFTMLLGDGQKITLFFLSSLLILLIKTSLILTSPYAGYYYYDTIKKNK